MLAMMFDSPTWFTVIVRFIESVSQSVSYSTFLTNVNFFLLPLGLLGSFDSGTTVLQALPEWFILWHFPHSHFPHVKNIRFLLHSFLSDISHNIYILVYSLTSIGYFQFLIAEHLQCLCLMLSGYWLLLATSPAWLHLWQIVLCLFRALSDHHTRHHATMLSHTASDLMFPFKPFQCTFLAQNLSQNLS